jgi:hypothetical protein
MLIASYCFCLAKQAYHVSGLLPFYSPEQFAKTNDNETRDDADKC